MCCIFLSGVMYSPNNVYNLYNGKALGSFSLTVFVISVSALCPIAYRNVSFFRVPVGRGIVAVLLSNWSSLINELLSQLTTDFFPKL